MKRSKVLEGIRELKRKSNVLFITYYTERAKKVAICNFNNRSHRMCLNETNITIGVKHIIPYEKIIKLY